MHPPTTLMLSSLVLSPASALALAHAADPVTWELSADGGVRRFDLAWYTASAPTGNGVNPAFTFAWDDITAVQADLDLCVRWNLLQLRGAVGYGRIVSGESTSTAYADDSRQQRTYRSEQQSDSGDVREGTVALGVRVFTGDTLTALVECGFTRSEQHLTMTDGVETTPANGPYAGLDSRYDTWWQGPWLGLAGNWKLAEAWSLLAHCRFHAVEYRGELDLNLRADLSPENSIEQAAHGYAVAVAAGVEYRITSHFATEVLLSHEDWRAANGEDRVNYRNGGSDTVPLDAVELSAWIARLGVRWEY